MQNLRRLPGVAWACLAAFVVWIAYGAVAVYAAATGGPFPTTTVHVVVLIALTSVLLATFIIALIQWLDQCAQGREADRELARRPTQTDGEIRTFDLSELRGFAAGSMARDDKPRNDTDGEPS